MRRYLTLAVVLLEAVCILLLIVRAARTPLVEQTIPYEDIVGTTVPDDRNGWYVDNTFPLSDDGLFDYTAGQSESTGVYQITVNYETDTDKNTSTVSAEDSSVLAESVILPSKLTSITYNIWLLGSSDQFSVQNYFGGEGYLVIKDISIVRTSLFERLECLAAAVLFILFDLLLFGILREGSLSKFLYRCRMAIVLLVIATIATQPALDGRIPLGDDIGFHMTRIAGLARSFQEGIVPCKLQTNWAYGYGYAVSLFYGDLFLSIPALLLLCGLPLGICYNIFLYLIHLSAALTSYLCCRKSHASRLISASCAAAYVLCPYVLIGCYYRSALGEAQAFVFWPLVLYGFRAILTEDTNSKDFRGASLYLMLGLTGMIESHMLSCVIFAQFLVLAVIVCFRRVFQKSRFLQLFKAAVWTLLVNAFFWVPMILSYHNLAITQPYRNAIRIQGYGLTLRDLMSWSWGADCRGLGELAFVDVTYTLGPVLSIVLFVCLLLMIMDRAKWKKHVLQKSTAILWCFCLLSLFMTTQYFPWNALATLLKNHATLLINVQFPWRYMEISAAFALFLMCDTLMALEKLQTKPQKATLVRYSAVLLTILAVGTTLPQLQDMTGQHFYDIGKFGRTDNSMSEYLYNADTQETVEDFMNAKIDPQTDYVPGHFETGDGVTVTGYSFEKLTATVTCTNTSGQDSWAELPLLYYEQYQAVEADGSALACVPGNKNVVRIEVPADYSGSITVTYVYPLSWKVSEWVSILSAVLLIGLAVIRKRRRTAENRKLPMHAKA